MNYLDETILIKREEKKREKYVTLEQGYYVKGEVIRFQRKSILNQFSILMPESFKQMPKEFAKIKYPSEFRPHRIITSMDLSVNLGFSIFCHELRTKDVKVLARRMRDAIRRANPHFQFFEFEESQKIGSCWFAYRSSAMDSAMYNLMMVAAVNGSILQASFNCLYQEFNPWKKVILLMWDSIEEIKGGDFK